VKNLHVFCFSVTWQQRLKLVSDLVQNFLTKIYFKTLVYMKIGPVIVIL